MTSELKHQKVYYLTGFVRIEAADDAEALRKFEEAGLGPEEEVIAGVTLAFEGGWTEIVDEPDPPCTCPPGLVERGGFHSSCRAHGSQS
jgi:hypothetical protein